MSRNRISAKGEVYVVSRCFYLRFRKRHFDALVFASLPVGVYKLLSTLRAGRRIDARITDASENIHKIITD